MEPADIQKLCKLSSAVNVYVAATTRLSELPGFSSPAFWPTKGIPRTAFLAEAHPAPLHTPTVRVKRATLTGSKDHSVELGPTRVSQLWGLRPYLPPPSHDVWAPPFSHL